MQNLKRIISLLLTLAMLCGLMPMAVFATEETEANPWRGRSAVFVGDSITAGSGTTKIYYSFLEEALGFGTVTAMGVGGSCISAASDYGAGNQPLINRYQNIPSTDLIVIFMGTNDYGHETPLGSVENTKDGTFYGALNTIIPALVAKHSSSKIVFVTPLHRYGFGTSKLLGTQFTYDNIPNGVGATLGDYVEALKTVCANNGVSVIDLHTECTLDPSDAAVRSTYMPDGLHPNAAGHEVIAGIMESHIRTYEPVGSEPVVLDEMIQGNKFASGNDQPCRASSRINYYLKAGTVITLKNPDVMQWACARTSNEYSSNNLGYFPDSQWSDKVTAVVAEDGWIGFTFKYRDETQVFDLSKPLSEYITIEEPHTHSYKSTVTAPTCTEQGYTSYTCECGDSYVADFVDAKGHSYENGICTTCGAEHPNLANFEGKVISILGDSISTFAGHIPVADGFNLAHRARYPQSNLLTDVNETWWMQILTALDAKLGINDSWAGSRVINTISGNSGDQGEKAAMASLTRIQNLGSNGTPDVILFYGGTNDIGASMPLGTFDPSTAPVEADLTSVKWNTVADAYVATLLRIKHFYPEAQIIAMLPTYTTSYYTNAKLAQYNTVFSAICDHYGIPCIDLRDCGISTANLPDGIHPDATGMDYITGAVLDTLLDNVEIEAGEHIVHSVTHNLNGAASSLGYYKGVTHERPFVTTITGENVTVSVTMGGTNITDTAYANDVVTIAAVTGDLVITAQGRVKPIYEDHLQQLPENLCCSTNIWTSLVPENTYYTGSAWGNVSGNSVYSITIPVAAGDQIWATSFQKSGTNGGSRNGIRLTWFDENGVLGSLSPDTVYGEFSANGYLTAPKDAVAANVVMWNGNESNEVYILNRDHTYSNGICTGCSVNEWDTDGDGVLEILAIGNSFSVDALEYAYQIAQNLGIEEIAIGNLYIGGCTLETHAKNAAGDLGKYTYYYNDNGTWTSTGSYKISTALESRSWDYVSMQQGSPVSGVESSYNQDLTNLIAYVKERSDAKLVWHMTWAYQQNSTHSAFPTYGKNQMTMYNAIVSAVQNKIVPNESFDLIVPNGTAVQNSRTSLLGDTTTRDGYHMSYDYGRYLTGLLFVKTLTGLDISNIIFAPSGVSTEEKQIAIESVNNAYKAPFAVTESDYQKEEPVIPKDYVQQKLGLTPLGYWNSSDKTGLHNQVITAASNAKQYYCTVQFTKEHLPVGSVILLEDGWQYRPEGWITDAAHSTRPDTTTEAYIVITEQWWGDYTLRAFNISKVGLPSLSGLTEADVSEAFQIYVPASAVVHTHTYTSVVTAPTCTEKGYTTYTCACGDSYVADFVDAKGHSYKNGTCTVCGAANPNMANLEGKTISILGASISTYTGISNNTAYNSTIGSNAVYYTEGRHGVYADDTWWMQVCNDMGLELLVNNSWSGSSLLYERNGTVGAYIDRCVQLHNNEGETPDIIGIQMGTNDFQYYKDTLGTADINYDGLITANGDGTYTYATPVTSLEAAAIVLHKISVRYPNAEVYYLNISQRVDGTDELIRTFNTELKQVVEHFGAHIVDIYGSAITMEDFDTYIGDGRVHPNKLGMDAYTEAFKRALIENTAYRVEAHTVSLALDGVTADYGDDKIVVDGDSFTLDLTASGGKELTVTVTMGGKDITASAYSKGIVTIDAVTADVTITAEATDHIARNYRWEFDGAELVSVGDAENILIKNAGTTTDGVFSKTRYALDAAVVLRHDQPWVVEWKCEGTFLNSNGSSGARIFTSTDVNAEYNARYIFKSNTNGIIAMGEKDAKGSHNYGIALADHGIDWTQLHTYRLENRIATDGSNMVYLYVDGAEIGPMNNYYVGTTNKNTTSNWLSGKDFLFPYMGTDTHGFTNASIEYIQVWEGRKPNQSQLTDYSGKVISILGGSTCTFDGYIPVADGFNLTHRPRYPQSNLLTDVNDTWWMQVIAELDAKLGINDSWAGSQVLNTLDSNSGDLGPDAAMASLTRILNLGANGTPDVILFYGAMNDIGRGVALGSFDAGTAPSQVDLTSTKWSNLADAYVAAILRMQHYYPDAEIVAMLPGPTASYYTEAERKAYCKVLKAICDHYGVPTVDLSTCGLTTDDMPDGTHPNAKGMDYIANAVLETLLSECQMEAGKNAVHSVTHELSGTESSLGYYKGVSDGESFITAITGENVIVTVTMGGVDITDQVYADGKIAISAVTGDVVITAKGIYNADGRLQQLPENYCCNTNLWTALDPVNEYYTASGWGNNSNSNYSVTFPVTPGDRIWATSFGAAGTNGYSENAVRITWFGQEGVLKSLSRDVVYAEFAKYGYITVPEGAVAVNIPMVSNADTWEIFILNRDHCYENGVCACGAADLKFYRANASSPYGQLKLTGEVIAYVTAARKGFDSYYVVFTYDNQGNPVTVQAEPSSSSDANYVLFDCAIPAPLMTADITATIYGVKDGVTYQGETIVYTIRECVDAKLNMWYASYGKNAQIAKLFDTLVNLLNYGAQAQTRFGVNTDKLATDGLPAEYAAKIKTDPVELNAYPAVDESGKAATLYNMSFKLQEKINMYGNFLVKSGFTAASDYTVKIVHTKADGSTVTYTITDLTKSGNYLYFEFSKLAPAQMRDELQITLYQKGVAVSATYIRSGDRVVNTLPAPLAALANAIMHYSDCAKAAFG